MLSLHELQLFQLSVSILRSNIKFQIYPMKDLEQFVAIRITYIESGKGQASNKRS